MGSQQRSPASGPSRSTARPQARRTASSPTSPWATDSTWASGLSLADVAAYDESASAARPGAEEAAELAASLPANADGQRPAVSNVGYYLPYPGDPQPYRLIAWLAIASVPVVFVACLAVAGRRFYRDRLAGPIAAMDDAAGRIASGDLDFSVAPQRADEFGRLCGQFEAMRAELERAEGELWRAAESRRQVNAAFAHDLRTPLTVVRGQAELIGRAAEGEEVRAAAAAIARQGDRLADFAESMRGLDALEGAVRPAPWTRAPGSVPRAPTPPRSSARTAGCSQRPARGCPSSWGRTRAPSLASRTTS